MSRSLLDKLRALEASARVGQSTSVDDSISSGNVEPTEPVGPVGPVESPVPSPEKGQTESDKAGFETIETRYGTCLRRQTSFDLCTYHGKHQFASVLHTDLTQMANLAAQTALTPETLRFYDVETNGLGTGAGTFPFLHTVGYIAHDELCLMQYFVDDYGAEKAVLHALHEDHFAADGVVVVTFNGKTFDWPLLQNRRVMHQLPKLDLPHLDLIHPSRRLWRKQLGRVKLVDLEAKILGLERLDDLPGSEAPERYFAFLDSVDFSLVEPVLSHNAMDVCSLVTLLTEIAHLLNGCYTELPSATHLALASWYEAWHQMHAASTSYAAAALADDADWRAKWLYSLHLKRQGDTNKACEIWRQLADQHRNQIEPLIELAKWYEHRTKQLELAEDAVMEALARLRGETRFGIQIPHRVNVLPKAQSASPLEQAMTHRLGRIRKKRNGLSNGG